MRGVKPPPFGEFLAHAVIALSTPHREKVPERLGDLSIGCTLVAVRCHDHGDRERWVRLSWELEGLAHGVFIGMLGARNE